MLEYLFGTPLIEKILFYILINEKCYASELKKNFNIPLFSIQRALIRLEKGGILVSLKEGNTLIFRFNLRYIFLPELVALLTKAYQCFPDEYKNKYYEPITRKRPRRRGKPL